MMTLLSPLLTLAALLALALWFCCRGVAGGIAPLCAVCAAGLLVAGFGCFGLLPLGGWLFFALGLAAAVWLAVRVFARKKPLPNPGFGFWFFALGALLLLVVFAVRRPVFIQWDEFSTWGTSAKQMKLYGELYVTAPIGFSDIWTTTQPPFLITLATLPQFFTPEFTPWQAYWGIDLLLLACIAALAARLEKPHWNIALPLFLLGCLTPFLLTLYRQPVNVAPPFLDTMADVPMGMLLGGVLAAWFGGSGKGPARVLPVLLGLAALTLCKETALALALVAAVLIFIDMLAAPAGEGPQAQRRFLPAAGRLLLGVAAVALAFLGWSAYLASAAGVNRFELGGTNNTTMSQLPALFLSDLLHPGQNERFGAVMLSMTKAFLTSMGSMLGSGAMIAVCILLLCGAASFLGGAALRRRCVAYGVFSTLGFIPYFLLISATYIYIFRPEQAAVLDSFERYLYPYYLGWMLGALALLALALREGRHPLAGRAGVLALSLLLSVRCFTVVPPSTSVVGFHHDLYNGRRAFDANVQALTATLEPDGRTFLVSTADDGLRWFQYCYSFLPYQLDYSYGGGEFIVRAPDENGDIQQTHIGPDAWAGHLLETGCTTVYIDEADAAFRDEYGHLFRDNMRRYFNGDTRLYTVKALAQKQAGDPAVRLIPVLEEDA